MPKYDEVGSLEPAAGTSGAAVTRLLMACIAETRGENLLDIYGFGGRRLTRTDIHFLQIMQI
jgi:hypothetical protein